MICAKNTEFGTRITVAHYNDSKNIWTITTANGLSASCYFVSATGILLIPKNPSFPGLNSYTGEWYQASNWSAHKADFRGKRIALVDTGSTGVHLIPKLAPVANELTMLQRRPNYVLPGGTIPTTNTRLSISKTTMMPLANLQK